MKLMDVKTKLLLVDDHAIVRAGFRYLLENESEYEFLEVETAEEACQVYEDYRPDVVIMDLMMPGMGGLEGLRHIKAKDKNAKVLVLSMRDDLAYVTRATIAGAAGYMTKKSASDELSKAVNVVINGQKYLSTDICESANTHSSIEDEEKIKSLTEREFEVFCLLAGGRSVVKISTDLHLSPKTVSNHRTRIMHKINASNVVELTRLAIRHGLIEA
ncbi:hypothetical protein MNBD_GAMMA07-1331 [hydrothermal vent metagenome]|uniref:Two-component transcriptional response regulator, LuxR family n=1 Tax=hydrothermal vent metagenome TaxID=652676 RepID=A0A3B0WL40_9ZZZZ